MPGQPQDLFGSPPPQMHSAQGAMSSSASIVAESAQQMANSIARAMELRAQAADRKQAMEQEWLRLRYMSDRDAERSAAVQKAENLREENRLRQQAEQFKKTYGLSQEQFEESKKSGESSRSLAKAQTAREWTGMFADLARASRESRAGDDAHQAAQDAHQQAQLAARVMRFNWMKDRIKQQADIAWGKMQAGVFSPEGVDMMTLSPGENGFQATPGTRGQVDPAGMEAAYQQYQPFGDKYPKVQSELRKKFTDEATKRLGEGGFTTGPELGAEYERATESSLRQNPNFNPNEGGPGGGTPLSEPGQVIIAGDTLKTLTEALARSRVPQGKDPQVYSSIKQRDLLELQQFGDTNPLWIATDAGGSNARFEGAPGSPAALAVRLNSYIHDAAANGDNATLNSILSIVPGELMPTGLPRTEASKLKFASEASGQEAGQAGQAPRRNAGGTSGNQRPQPQRAPLPPVEPPPIEQTPGPQQQPMAPPTKPAAALVAAGPMGAPMSPEEAPPTEAETRQRAASVYDNPVVAAAMRQYAGVGAPAAPAAAQRQAPSSTASDEDARAAAYEKARSSARKAPGYSPYEGGSLKPEFRGKPRGGRFRESDTVPTRPEPKPAAKPKEESIFAGRKAAEERNASTAHKQAIERASEFLDKVKYATFDNPNVPKSWPKSKDEAVRRHIQDIRKEYGVGSIEESEFIRIARQWGYSL